MNDRWHQSVLLEEAVEALIVSSNGVYLDGTFGGGGHSQHILERLSPIGALMAFDRDPAAQAIASELSRKDNRFAFKATKFSRLGLYVQPRSLDGVLLDLGISSPQIDNPSRGFSFSRSGPLDMRMDPRDGESAAEWLAVASERDISDVLRKFGEERFARRIAKAIIKERSSEPIITTRQLAEIISAANPSWEQNKHPATRSFLAIRLHINQELKELSDVLDQIVISLANGGRLVVISFHSLEDRIVKRFIRAGGLARKFPAGVPVRHFEQPATLRAVGKIIRPSAQEIAKNPRARSAVMRVAERVN